MCASLYDAARLHHQNLIGPPNSRETVRDDERGAAFHEVMQPFLDCRLRLRVQARRRFVQNQDARICQNGARDRDALPLSTGEFHAALADDGVVFLLELFRELIHARDAAGFQDLLLCGGRRAKPTFSRIDPSNRKVSCRTTPNCIR